MAPLRVAEAAAESAASRAAAGVAKAQIGLRGPNQTVKQRVVVPKQPPAGKGGGQALPGTAKPPGRKYNLTTGFPFPLGPLSERKTIMTEVGATLQQSQGRKA